MELFTWIKWIFVGILTISIVIVLVGQIIALVQDSREMRRRRKARADAVSKDTSNRVTIDNVKFFMDFIEMVKNNDYLDHSIAAFAVTDDCFYYDFGRYGINYFADRSQSVDFETPYRIVLSGNVESYRMSRSSTYPSPKVSYMAEGYPLMNNRQVKLYTEQLKNRISQLPNVESVKRTSMSNSQEYRITFRKTDNMNFSKSWN